MRKQGKQVKRPVGRPRADGGQHLTRDALLKATAKLVAANGYTGTSFRMIAGELDVTPASIFNLYPSKEKLLNALIAHGVEPFLCFYEELNALNLSPPTALYKSIIEEALAVNSFDRDYVSLFKLPELRRPEFAEAQAVRKKMVAHYRLLIEQGKANGEFVVSDVAWTAEQIFQLTETSAVADEISNNLSIADHTSITADFCLRGLLVDQGALDGIRKECRNIPGKIMVN